MSCIKTLARTLGAASAVAPLLTATTAWAQPNPFDDYEAGVETPPEPPPKQRGAEDRDTGKPETKDVGYTTEQFQVNVGLGTQLSYSGTSNEVLSGDKEANRTLFVRLGPRIGFFPVERFELGLSLGLLSQLVAREGGDSSAANNFLIEAQAHYHVPIGSGFALIPGLGLGGYVGASSRKLQLNGGQLDEKTKTSGFAGNIYLGAAYQPGEHWRLRSGIVLGILYGSEKVESQNRSLSASAAHIGLPIQFEYVF